jgi:hypothetical protein
MLRTTVRMEQPPSGAPLKLTILSDTAIDKVGVFLQGVHAALLTPSPSVKEMLAQVQWAPLTATSKITLLVDGCIVIDKEMLLSDALSSPGSGGNIVISVTASMS